ncbi:MAG: LPS assembly lipoprotein LptE [Vicinamibacterales bacterium]
MPRRMSCLAAVVLALVTTGCGYSLAGRGSFLPPEIKIIGVPEFTNRTPVFNLETQLTQKVRSEFIGRGKYQILPETTGVDAILTGEVSNVNVQPASFTAQNIASRYIITMTARVELRDVKADTVLWENPGLVFRQEFDPPSAQATGGTIDAAAFLGQDLNALERITNDFARTIVSAILEAF